MALPVYEIFKVGEDPHWKPGLDLFAPFGLKLVIVSHWNNSEGGLDLDTSRCFLGRERFDPLLAQLPADVTVLGIDELTGVILDLQAETCQVVGKDNIHLIHNGKETIYGRGDVFSICNLGDFQIPADLSAGIRPQAWQAALDAHHQALQPVEVIRPSPGDRSGGTAPAGPCQAGLGQRGSSSQGPGSPRLEGYRYAGRAKG